MKISLIVIALATNIFSQNSFAQNVGIGTTTPGAKLHIVNGASGYSSAYFPGMILEGNSNTYLNLLTPDNSESSVLFGKASDLSSGGIVYNNLSTLNGFQFRTNGNLTRLVINSAGNVGIGNTDPGFLLDVNNRIRIRSGGLGNTAGIWLNKTDNTALQSFIGIENDNYVGFFGGVAGWKFGMNTQTGALKINGSEGQAGQVLQSNGAGLAPAWVNSATATVHYIGEGYGGGIVFYVYENGQHGLIAPTSDQYFSIQWSISNTNTNAFRNGIGANSYNTEHIIANQGAGIYAAIECAKYSGGGYGDWYLPSRYELNLLYLQKNVVGGFANAKYWSSSEAASNVAWYQDFGTGDQNTNFKPTTYYMRAIRAF